jgi:serine/threonine protein kinase
VSGAALYPQTGHPDLKPVNLMLDSDGNLKVADLGISATNADSMSRMTRDMGSSGTPSCIGGHSS